MKLKKTLTLTVLAGAFALAAFAADLAGKWKSTFDTQIGEQHYTYEFKTDGEKLTGTATSDNGSTEIKEGTIKGDQLSFVENFTYQGNEIRIEYSGKVSGDEINLTRKVGDYATEEIVAKRVK